MNHRLNWEFEFDKLIPCRSSKVCKTVDMYVGLCLAMFVRHPMAVIRLTLEMNTHAQSKHTSSEYITHSPFLSANTDDIMVDTTYIAYSS